jgi:ankyrin repeat protein
MLLEAKADINSVRHPGYSHTALQSAVDSGRLELLLSAGASVNAAEGQVPSALHIASEKGNFVIVKMLLNAGADLNAISYTGETVIQAAERVEMGTF